METTSILEHLKAETATWHKKVESVNLAKHIIDHSIRLDDYKKLLVQNYVTYKATETCLLANKNVIDSVFSSFINASKSEALMKDLEAQGVLGYTHLVPKFEVRNPNELLGVLYVIEGSMLGGMLISKNLKLCSQLNSVQKHYFFENTPKLVTTRWKEFCDLITRKTYTPNEIAEITKGANHTFKLFYENILSNAPMI